MKSELEVFKALQLFGRLSSGKLSKKTGMSATTVQGICNRIESRGFYEVKAIPRLEHFSEIPMAFLGFSNVHPEKMKHLREKGLGGEQVRLLVHSGRDVLLFLVEKDKDRLTEHILEIMDTLQAHPAIRILTPSIARLDMTIPGKVLDRVYGGLPDKRRR